MRFAEFFRSFSAVPRMLIHFLGVWGGQPISIKSQVQKSPNPARGGGGGGEGHHHFGLIPKFRCFFDWKASLRHIANKSLQTRKHTINKFTEHCTYYIIMALSLILVDTAHEVLNSKYPAWLLSLKRQTPSAIHF